MNNADYRRIERMIASRQRRRGIVNFFLCAVVLIVGIGVLLSIIMRWFIVF